MRPEGSGAACEGECLGVGRADRCGQRAGRGDGQRWCADGDCDNSRRRSAATIGCGVAETVSAGEARIGLVIDGRATDRCGTISRCRRYGNRSRSPTAQVKRERRCGRAVRQADGDAACDRRLVDYSDAIALIGAIGAASATAVGRGDREGEATERGWRSGQCACGRERHARREHTSCHGIAERRGAARSRIKRRRISAATLTAGK